MAASGFTPISLYYSTTASAAPTAGNLVPGELGINITDGKMYYEDNLGAVQMLASLARTNGNFGDITSSITVAKGTTGQQPGSPVTGMLRYNTTSNQFEGYQGGAWGQLGGGATGGGGDEVFQENSLIVTTNYTITTGKNAMSVGPITINSGTTVTVGADQRWVVL
jgi:hypothetical protein